MADLKNISAIGGSLYAYGREAKIEPGYVMGHTVNNFTLLGSLDSILEGIGDI